MMVECSMFVMCSQLEGGNSLVVMQLQQRCKVTDLCLSCASAIAHTTHTTVQALASRRWCVRCAWASLEHQR